LLAAQPPVSGRRFEVLNAGVAGYSSHQGMQRFLQEIDVFAPDLVVVSFGWNDAADASGQPDKAFKIPAWPVIACQRALVRYRAYLVMMYYTRNRRALPPVARPGTLEHRVNIQDYLANLERFRHETEKRGIPVVFLTRPHKCSPVELSKNPTWRGSVPEYNAALVQWARKKRATVLDVQGIFERLPATLFADECHFTPLGYEQLGRLVYQQLGALPGNSLRVVPESPTTAVEHRPVAVREQTHSSQNSQVARR
jgi:lysophospholipase L1-like esterase